MSSTAVIFSDVIGAPRRAAAMAAICEARGYRFLHIRPWDIGLPGTAAAPVRLPDTWLPPAGTTSRPAYWLRAQLLYVVAARMIPPADFYWCVEADVCARPVVWHRLFDLTAPRGDDGLFTRLHHRDNSPQNHWLQAPGIPDWVVWYVHGALSRVSARALGWLEEVAATTAPYITEAVLPSVIALRGGTIGTINTPGLSPSLYNCQTLPFQVPLIFDPARINHPVKRDDPPAGTSGL